MRQARLARALPPSRHRNPRQRDRTQPPRSLCPVGRRVRPGARLSLFLPHLAVTKPTMRPSPANTPLPGTGGNLGLGGIQFETVADLSASVTIVQRKRKYPVQGRRIRLSSSPAVGARVEAFEEGGKQVNFPITSDTKCDTKGMHVRSGSTMSVELSFPSTDPPRQHGRTQSVHRPDSVTIESDEQQLAAFCVAFRSLRQRAGTGKLGGGPALSNTQTAGAAAGAADGPPRRGRPRSR